MLTGTPLDLTHFGALLTAVGWLYWLLAAGALWWAMRGPRAWKTRLLRALPIVIVFGLLPGKSAWEGYQARKRLDAAVAQFQLRCTSAGEKIVRTVDNVEGVVLMKWRDKRDINDDYDQYKLSDPYGRDCSAEEYIAQLLRLENTAGRFEREVALRKGRYRFIEAIDDADGKRYRFTGTMKLMPAWTPEAIERFRRNRGTDPPESAYWFQLERTPLERYTARYGITWDDISTRQDRDHWIAGGSINVIDLQTNEVIAERVGYMMDRGLGDSAIGRSPWMAAPDWACPAFPRSTGGGAFRGNRYHAFIFKVLTPTEEK